MCCAAQELAAPVALQRVALDLVEADARAAGVDALARLLWAGAQPAQRFSGLSYSRAELLVAVRPYLTAAEQARGLDQAQHHPVLSCARTHAKAALGRTAPSGEEEANSCVTRACGCGRARARAHLLVRQGL